MTDAPSLPPQIVPTLTARQRDVARCIGDGLEYKQIVARLRISRGRVDQIVRRIAKIVGPPDYDPELRLSARDTVFYWECHRRWQLHHHPPTTPLAIDVVHKDTERASA